MALAETQRLQFMPHRLRQLGNGLAPGRRELLAEASQFGVQVRQSGVQAGQFGVARFEGLKLAGRLFAKGADLRQGGTILPLEGLEEVEALLQFGQARGVEFEAVRVAAKRGLEVLEGGGGQGVQFSQRGGAGVDALKVLQDAAERAQTVQDGLVGVLEEGVGALAELEELGGVGGALVLLEQRAFLVRLDARGGDLARLKAQQVELLRIGALINDRSTPR